MKRHSEIYPIVCLLVCGLTGCLDIKSSFSGQSAQNYVSGITRNSSSESFDSDWRFLRADTPGAEAFNFDDSAWRRLDIPHNWSIGDLPPLEKPFLELSVVAGQWRFQKGDDAAKILTIGPCKDDFHGMLKERTFNVVLVKDNHGHGVAPVETPDQVVKYHGTEVKVGR